MKYNSSFHDWFEVCVFGVKILMKIVNDSTDGDGSYFRKTCTIEICDHLTIFVEQSLVISFEKDKIVLSLVSAKWVQAFLISEAVD